MNMQGTPDVKEGERMREAETGRERKKEGTPGASLANLDNLSG
jgi:hypothetical protein